MKEERARCWSDILAWERNGPGVEEIFQSGKGMSLKLKRCSGLGER
jgi:hypothetical protein